MYGPDDYFDDEMMGLYGDPTGGEFAEEFGYEEDDLEDYGLSDEDQEDTIPEDDDPYVHSLRLRQQGKGDFSNPHIDYHDLLE